MLLQLYCFDGRLDRNGNQVPDQTHHCCQWFHHMRNRRLFRFSSSLEVPEVFFRFYFTFYGMFVVSSIGKQMEANGIWKVIFNQSLHNHFCS